MAHEIHTDEAATTPREVALVLTYNECPERPGLTRRWAGLMSAALMIGYIFHGRVRYAFRVLSDAEKAAYQAERGQLWSGEGI